jgi:Flp pilus assembly protein TadD
LPVIIAVIIKTKEKRMNSLLKLGLGAVMALALAVGATGSVAAQKPADQPKVSSGEADLGKKIQSAPKLEEKFTHAQKLLEKYPKSALRPKVAEYLLNEISGVKDGEQRVSFIENYLGLFTEASEQELAVPYLIDAYTAAKRYDDAFGLAPRAVEKDPDNAVMLTQLAIAGGDLANAGKNDFVEPAKQYAAKAIALMEADKKPAGVNDAFWADFRKNWLPSLYQAQGIMLRAAKKPDEARASISKAISLSPANAFNYYLLGVMADEEYNAIAKQYQITPIGPAKEALLTKAQAKLDEVIDWYAQTLGKAALNPAYKSLQDNLRPNLEAYYKFRKGSLNGLQELIDKYKK